MPLGELERAHTSLEEDLSCLQVIHDTVLAVLVRTIAPDGLAEYRIKERLWESNDPEIPSAAQLCELLELLNALLNNQGGSSSRIRRVVIEQHSDLIDMLVGLLRPIRQMSMSDGEYAPRFAALEARTASLNCLIDILRLSLRVSSDGSVGLMDQDERDNASAVMNRVDASGLVEILLIFARATHQVDNHFRALSLKALTVLCAETEFGRVSVLDCPSSISTLVSCFSNDISPLVRKEAGGTIKLVCDNHADDVLENFSIHELISLFSVDASVSVRVLALDILLVMLFNGSSAAAAMAEVGNDLLKAIHDRIESDGSGAVQQSALRLLKHLLHYYPAIFAEPMIKQRYWEPLVEILQRTASPASILAVSCIRVLFEKSPPRSRAGRSVLSHMSTLSTILKVILEEPPQQNVELWQRMHQELALCVGMAFAQDPECREHVRREMKMFPMWMFNVKKCLLRHLARCHLSLVTGLVLSDVSGYRLNDGGVVTGMEFPDLGTSVEDSSACGGLIAAINRRSSSMKSSTIDALVQRVTQRICSLFHDQEERFNQHLIQNPEHPFDGIAMGAGSRGAVSEADLMLEAQLALDVCGFVISQTFSPTRSVQLERLRSPAKAERNASAAKFSPAAGNGVSHRKSPAVTAEKGRSAAKLQGTPLATSNGSPVPKLDFAHADLSMESYVNGQTASPRNENAPTPSKRLMKAAAARNMSGTSSALNDSPISGYIQTAEGLWIRAAQHGSPMSTKSPSVSMGGSPKRSGKNRLEALEYLQPGDVFDFSVALTELSAEKMEAVLDHCRKYRLHVKKVMLILPGSQKQRRSYLKKAEVQAQRAVEALETISKLLKEHGASSVVQVVWSNTECAYIAGNNVVAVATMLSQVPNSTWSARDGIVQPGKSFASAVRATPQQPAQKTSPVREQSSQSTDESATATAQPSPGVSIAISALERLRIASSISGRVAVKFKSTKEQVREFEKTCSGALRQAQETVMERLEEIAVIVDRVKTVSGSGSATLEDISNIATEFAPLLTAYRDEISALFSTTSGMVEDEASQLNEHLDTWASMLSSLNGETGRLHERVPSVESRRASEIFVAAETPVKAGEYVAPSRASLTGPQVLEKLREHMRSSVMRVTDFLKPLNLHNAAMISLDNLRDCIRALRVKQLGDEEALALFQLFPKTSDDMLEVRELQKELGTIKGSKSG